MNTKRKKQLGGTTSNENIGFWGIVGSAIFPVFVAPVIAIINWEDNPKKAKQALGIGAVTLLAGLLFYSNQK